MRSGVYSLLIIILVACLGSCGPSKDIDLLLVAPFSKGLAPAADDPDTLRRGLRGDVATLRMLPRNVSEPGELREAMEEADFEIVWIRSDRNMDDWARAVPETWTGLLILSRPPARPSPLPTLDPAPAGPVLLTDAARSDRRHIQRAQLLLRALREGSSLREALGRAFDSTDAWTLIGDGDWKVAHR